ncbi:PDZ/DHR/GLGF domain protein [Dictyocaulus viviparus]|uniref:PDZ/DHR/GLGF domain protein n=1 Tax=Dictyocaulus viviparus TaxID=29172 RepID=A0A0D8XTY4_DICVI|nr:PDZ/DHR/GLGF domain protein [Dictyocaulus viviparus]
MGLPYGWEQARDESGNIYYIDHVHRLTTYMDPRHSAIPEGQRTVTLKRNPEFGYGFVAAGQYPTIIQFVSIDGPSDGVLFANDQILEVNGIDVRQETKDSVVMRIRSSKDDLQLTVEQLPARPRSARRTCRVRFTERVLVASIPDSSSEFLPPLPNALRVYLENGQTRSFRYDNTTTVKDIMNSICSKLELKAKSHFALAIEYSLGARSSRISLLRPDVKIDTIVRMPNSDHLRVVFRFAFIPKKIESLWSQDPKALDYFYQQCTADVIRGRYAFEMRYEACIRLATLHMQQVAIESNLLKENNTVSLTRLEMEYGMNSFIPTILLENVKPREIRKHIRYYLKRDSAKLSETLSKLNFRGDMNQPLHSLRLTDPSVSLRIRYLDLLSNLPSFGGRGFSVTFKESQIDMIIQVDPRAGLLVRHPGKTGRPTISIDFGLIDRLVVRRDSEIASLISFRMTNSPDQGLEFLVDKDDIDDLVGYICGYQLIQCNRQLICDFDDTPPIFVEPRTDPPPYSAVHKVVPCEWNYAGDIPTIDRSLDLTVGPPSYELANSFAEEQEDVETDSESKIDRSLKTPSPSRSNTDAVKKSLLHATDSLLIKKSQDLQKKEVMSPLVSRSVRLMESISDSSDVDDTSLSSPFRSTLLNGDTMILLNGSPEQTDSSRRESIETLISSVHAQHVVVIF